MKKIVILKETDEPKPTGEGWRKVPPGHTTDTGKYEYSQGGAWYRDKTILDRVRDSTRERVDNLTNTGLTGIVYNDAKEELKKLKQWAKNATEKITYQMVIDKFANMSDYLYEKGKGGLKKVSGDIKDLIDMIPETPENVNDMSLEKVMGKKIPLAKGSEGDNITELHDIIKKIGKTISEDEFNGSLFGDSTETAIKDLQKEFGLPVTGVLNKKTYDKLLNYQPPIEEPIQKVKGQKHYVYESVLINEAEELNIQKEFLTECKNLGCFDSYITNWELNKEPELSPLNLDGSEIYIFAYKMTKNPNVEICFGADNWIYQIITDKKNNETKTKLDQRWFCGNKYCNTPPRQNYVKELIQSSPGTYELQKSSDQSEKIDLNDETKKNANEQSIGNKKLFPKSNMCFIFRRGFEKGTVESVIGQVETLLNNAGFTMNEPGISSYQKISFPVKNILGTSLTSQQKMMFKDQLERKAYPNSDSKQVNFIPKDTRLFGESCKSIYTKLSNAIEDPYSNFFSDKGETGKYTTLMQYKIMAMKCEESPKYMDFCRKNDDNRNICNNVRYSDSEYGIRDLIQNKTSTNENFISKTIKEHLIKLSKQKKKSLLEKRIVENRFKVLVENKNPRRIKDVNKFVQEAYDEMTYLSNQKYETNLISESLFDMMKLFVGPTGEQSVKKTFKQYVTNNLIQKLTPNKPNGYLAKIIEKTISELDLRDAPKLTDCYFVSEILTQSILNQIMIQKQKAEHHIENPLDELVKDSIFDSLYESNIHERLSSGISNYICPRLNQIQSNLDNKFIQSKNRIF